MRRPVARRASCACTTTSTAEAALAWRSFPYFLDWSAHVGAGDPGFVRTGFLEVVPPELLRRRPRQRGQPAGDRHRHAASWGPRRSRSWCPASCSTASRRAPTSRSRATPTRRPRPRGSWRRHGRAGRSSSPAAASERLLVDGGRVTGVGDGPGRVLRRGRGRRGRGVVRGRRGDGRRGAAGHAVAPRDRLLRAAGGSLRRTSRSSSTTWAASTGDRRARSCCSSGSTRATSWAARPIGRWHRCAADIVEDMTARLVRRLPWMEHGTFRTGHCGQDGITPDQRAILGTPARRPDRPVPRLRLLRHRLQDRARHRGRHGGADPGRRRRPPRTSAPFTARPVRRRAADRGRASLRGALALTPGVRPERSHRNPNPHPSLGDHDRPRTRAPDPARRPGGHRRVPGGRRPTPASARPGTWPSRPRRWRSSPWPPRTRWRGSSAFANANRIPVAVQASGHGAFVPRRRRDPDRDAARWTRSTIHADERWARVGAGVRWQAVLDAAAPHGLAALAGSSPGVSVVGYTTGGGHGPLARHAGPGVRPGPRVRRGHGRRRAAARDRDPGARPVLGPARRQGRAGHRDRDRVRPAAHPDASTAAALWFDGADAGAVLRAWAAWCPDLPAEATTSVALMQPARDARACRRRSPGG